MGSERKDILAKTVDAVSTRRGRRNLVSKAWRHLPGERPAIIGLATLAVVVAQAESVALVLIALIADSIVRGQANIQLEVGPLDLSLAVPTAGALTGVTLLAAAIFVFTYGRLTAVISARLERNTRDEVVSSYAEADWEYQSTLKSSRVQGRILTLMTSRMETFIGLVAWIRAVTTITVFVTVAAVMSPLAAGVIVVFAAILSLAILPLRRRVVRLAGKAANEEVGLAADVAEAADHGADVHVFGAWPAFLSFFNRRSRALQQLRARLLTIVHFMPAVYQYGALTLILLIMIVAFGMQATGEFGRFAASGLLVLRSVQYGQQLQSALQHLAKYVPRVELLNRELTTPPPRVLPGVRVLEKVDRVQLRHVGYQYPGAASPALSDVSLDLRPGTIVGVAGPSGSGKSTLAQILLRIRWPISGQYLVNGVPAQEYSLATWNRLVSHVPQQPHLLHASLVENVTFFDESISRDKVAASLRAVGLQELVESLPGGLDEPLGPTGRSLSGGQVQRLGIARALVRDPLLVVLDEPTSALDANAERLVGEALAVLRGRLDVLILVIAHRPSTLALCDEMVVLEAGRVSASGRSADVAVHSEFVAGMRRAF